MDITCGIFLYDSVNKKILVTRSYGSRKFESLSIPKGMFDTDLDKDYVDAAFREFKEETSIDLIKLFDNGEQIQNGHTFFNLGFTEYSTKKKKLNSFLLISKDDLSDLVFICNSFFEKEGKEFPEISEYFWLTLDEAKGQLHETQANLIPKIVKIINQ